MISIVFYGIIAYLIFRSLKGWMSRLLVIIGWIAISGFIGFSRLYLGVHYFTDVLGGWSAGLMWLASCILGDKFLSRAKFVAITS